MTDELRHMLCIAVKRLDLCVMYEGSQDIEKYKLQKSI